MIFDLPSKKPKKFILIDHTIMCEGGHNLEYAKRVLNSAKLAGLETILVTNKKFETRNLNNIDIVFNIFIKNYWDYKRGISRLRLILWLAMGVDFKSLPFFQADGFVDALECFFSKMPLHEGDIVFFPMIGASELVGIALLGNTIPIKKTSWHFVFRFDFYHRSILRGIKSVIDKWAINYSLLKTRDLLVNLNPHFYTDTDLLTKIYNDFKTQPFETIAIPSLNGFKILEEWDGSRPMRIVYLGDARDEKGFHYLPNLVRRIRASGLDSSDIHFIFQSNLSIGGNSKSIIARRDLKFLNDDGLTLLGGPLNAQNYQNLLESADIVLLPYIAHEYSSRSSGIFVESVSAGVPVIFPENSWMSKQASGRCGLGFVFNELLFDSVIEMIKDYRRYKQMSIESAPWFKNLFSAKKIVSKILINSYQEEDIR